MVVSTLYVTRSLFEHIKKKRQSNNQAAPIPTISGSIRGQSHQQPPQIQLNNNQFNPEVLDLRFLYLVVVLILITVTMFIISVYGNYYFPDDTIIQVMKRILELKLGIYQAVGLTIVMSYPYVTNDRLRRFITDEYFH